ncbi:hypothetical protein BP6252_06547 [Coleophoma cylindrospora]|uniref:RelA/SpoT domain-containing protein n=1 Tax=Coleophoma cylindrospora TaxID=1849047 RepID=A0A3D8RMX2_9HELO|nr:hypothetical protein BP6252_06547 [Coleophoma cylindrospora]
MDNENDIVKLFKTNWPDNEKIYADAAQYARDLCEAGLEENNIHAIVTHRVKKVDRIEIKIRERMARATVYHNFDDILNDLPDLAGVRIAVYFPSDRKKLEEIITNSFDLIVKRQFPAKGSEHSTRFGGYSAEHFRVNLKVDRLTSETLQPPFQKLSPKIEIQVMSVLMLAWAEVDHKLVLKQKKGMPPPSPEELQMLDALNGIVQTGEVLLDGLQTAFCKRELYKDEL